MFPCPSFPIQCPDSACKQDLLAYLQRIALYCHQLNICSKVKAEVQNLGGELIVSGVSLTTQSRTWLSPQQALRLEWMHLVILELIFFIPLHYGWANPSVEDHDEAWESGIKGHAD